METGQLSGNTFYTKKQVKSDVSRGVIAVILNLFIMNVVVIAYMVVKILLVYMLEVLRRADDMQRALVAAEARINDVAFLNSLMESGTPYLISIVIGGFFVWLIMRAKAPVKKIFAVDNKMNVKAFVMCLIVLMSVQIPISLLDALIEVGLNAIGLTGELGMEMATAGSTTVTMFLYVSFGAPIAEELVFRGFILKSLEKYGKTFAIIISSILFGLMHTNLIQSIFAMIVGFILGYVAMNYSLKWSILLHAINNCLFGELMILMMKGLNEEVQGVIELGVFGSLCIAGITILIVKRKSLAQYVRENLGAKEHYKFAFSSVWLWVFIIGASLAGLTVIQKL